MPSGSRAPCRHRRRHAWRTGATVPVLIMTASTESFLTVPWHTRSARLHTLARDTRQVPENPELERLIEQAERLREAEDGLLAGVYISATPPAHMSLPDCEDMPQGRAYRHALRVCHGTAGKLSSRRSLSASARAHPCARHAVGGADMEPENR